MECFLCFVDVSFSYFLGGWFGIVIVVVLVVVLGFFLEFEEGGKLLGFVCVLWGKACSCVFQTPCSLLSL